MSVDLSGVLTSLGSVFGTNAAGAQPLATQIIQQVAVGAAASGFLAALQHPDVKAAFLPFDPLNLAGKQIVNQASAPGASAATHVITAAQAASLGWTPTTLPAGVIISG
jgi:hypothetical protein